MHLPRRALLAAALPLPAFAQATRPIRLLVPFPGGGTMDLVARLLAPLISARLGATIVIENRPGGGTVIATQEAARAAGDGNTLLMVSNSFTINPAIQRSLPYDVERDFTPLTQVTVIPHILVVHPSVEAQDLHGLLALARRRPGGLAYASYGPGTSNHLNTEMLAARAGVAFTHVPYRGSAQWVPDLLEGRVQFTLANLPDVVPAVREGRLRALAVAHATRVSAAPEVPVFAELGFPGFASSSWFGFVAPAGLPESQRDRIAAALRAPLALPEVRARLAELWIEPLGTEPEAFRALIRAERALYADAVRIARLTPE